MRPGFLYGSIFSWSGMGRQVVSGCLQGYLPLVVFDIFFRKWLQLVSEVVGQLVYGHDL
jgi:ABC-type dipeptide/oligopeptide/nickel transport system permease component